MLNSTLMFLLATPTYLTSFLLYAVHLAFASGPRFQTVPADGTATSALRAPSDHPSGWERAARWAGGLGVVLTTAGVVWRTVELGNASGWVLTVFLPITTTYETLTFLAWIVPLVYFLVERRARFPGVGMILTFIAFALLAVAALPSVAPRAVAPVMPALQSYWL